MRSLTAVSLVLALGGLAHARPSRPAPRPSAPPSAPSTTPAPPVEAAPPSAPAAPPAPVTPPTPPPPPPAPVETTAAPAPAAAAVAAAPSITIEEDEGTCALPPAVTAVDPIRSGVTPGAAPELAPPQLDVLGASLGYNAEGATVDTVVAPAAFGAKRHVPVVSDLRLQLYARGDFQRLGAALSLGWDSASAKLVDESDRAAGPCTAARERALQKARFDRAYRNRIVVRLAGGAEVLPILLGPKVQDPASGAFVDPAREAFGGWRGVLQIGYFANRQFGLWLVGGAAGSRAIHGVRGVNLRAGAGLDLAYQLALGPLRADGFQPGITIGAFGRYSKCVTAEGCDEDVRGYNAPIAFDSLIAAGAYVDFRLSNLAQVRLAIPTNYYVLASAPAGSEGGANIVEVLPTIAVSIASWGL